MNFKLVFISICFILILFSIPLVSGLSNSLKTSFRSAYADASPSLKKLGNNIPEIYQYSIMGRERIESDVFSMKKNYTSKYRLNNLPNQLYKPEYNGQYKILVDFPEGPLEDYTYQIDQDTDNVLIIGNSLNLMMIRKNVPSGSEAVLDAELILAQYEGIPEDATFAGSETVYWKKIGTGYTDALETLPTYTEVRYTRLINNRPVVGGGGVIEIYLGNNGELLRFYKIWHKISGSESFRIISSEKAFERLKQGYTLNGIPETGRERICINAIQLGYYEKGPDEYQEKIDPVWIFSGFTENNNNPVVIIVQALV